MRAIVCRFGSIAFITAGLVLVFVSLKVAAAQKATETAGEPSAIELPPAATGKVDFNRDIQPILEQNCFQCHGPNMSMSGLRLDTQARALQGGNSGPVIVPG
ncbi:hypothetical protein MYX65_11840, partial [Acidobacteria bacterium AH-259-L09]|nr:hypothetical protein [Acidobacteria bacterium AH-259-L09]